MRALPALLLIAACGSDDTTTETLVPVEKPVIVEKPVYLDRPVIVEKPEVDDLHEHRRHRRH